MEKFKRVHVSIKPPVWSPASAPNLSESSSWTVMGIIVILLYGLLNYYREPVQLMVRYMIFLCNMAYSAGTPLRCLPWRFDVQWLIRFSYAERPVTKWCTCWAWNILITDWTETTTWTSIGITFFQMPTTGLIRMIRTSSPLTDHPTAPSPFSTTVLSWVSPTLFAAEPPVRRNHWLQGAQCRL